MRTTPAQVNAKHREWLAIAAKSDVSHADSRNMLYEKTGMMLTYHQVSYLCDVTTELLFGKKKRAGDASNNVIEYLNGHSCRYVSLCEKSVTDGVNKIYICHKDGVSIHEHVVNDGFLESTISLFATKYRCAYKVKENQHLFKAVAWATNHELLRFSKSPEVIHVDGTSKTNKEKFILFTVSVKDRSGKMCIVMRAFLPNEKN